VTKKKTVTVLECDWVPVLGVCVVSWETKSGKVRQRSMTAKEATEMFDVDVVAHCELVDGMEMGL
jgi:hypothetical protein